MARETETKAAGNIWASRPPDPDPTQGTGPGRDAASSRMWNMTLLATGRIRHGDQSASGTLTPSRLQHPHTVHAHTLTHTHTSPQCEEGGTRLVARRTRRGCLTTMRASRLCQSRWEPSATTRVRRHAVLPCCLSARGPSIVGRCRRRGRVSSRGSAVDVGHGPGAKEEGGQDRQTDRRQAGRPVTGTARGPHEHAGPPLSCHATACNHAKRAWLRLRWTSDYLGSVALSDLAPCWEGDTSVGRSRGTKSS